MPLIVFLCLLACSLSSQALSVSDYLGRTVSLDKPAARVIALAPHVVENLYAAGAGDTLVAAVDYSDYPSAARKLPRVGGFNSISLETVLSYSPDLVVVWVSGNGSDHIRQLEDLGIPVYADEPRELSDIARSIRDLGVLTGRREKSEEVADYYLDMLATLRSSFGEKRRLDVFYEVWHQPLQTVNGEHIITDVIELCGGRNIFAEAQSLAPVINIEAVLQRDPDVILASGSGETRPTWLDDWNRFPGLTAVRRKQVHFIPPDYLQRHTLRLLEGAKMVCNKLNQSR